MVRQIGEQNLIHDTSVAVLLFKKRRQLKRIRKKYVIFSDAV